MRCILLLRNVVSFFFFCQVVYGGICNWSIANVWRSTGSPALIQQLMSKEEPPDWNNISASKTSHNPLSKEFFFDIRHSHSQHKLNTVSLFGASMSNFQVDQKSSGSFAFVLCRVHAGLGQPWQFKNTFAFFSVQIYEEFSRKVGCKVQRYTIYSIWHFERVIAVVAHFWR